MATVHMWPELPQAHASGLLKSVYSCVLCHRALPNTFSGKGADLIAVKVLSDSGFGTVSDMYANCNRVLAPILTTTTTFSVAGLNFVMLSAIASRRPSIASMSLGGPVAPALDNAVAAVRPFPLRHTACPTQRGPSSPGSVFM